MDRTIPEAAAHLLRFVYKTETSRDPPDCYEVIYAHKQNTLPKPLTSMTISEVLIAQRDWTRRHGSSAAGAPQFIRATLAGLYTELGLRDGQIFNGDLQDRLAYHLLKRRGYEAYMAGTLSVTKFGRRLAQEWASFPVLAATRGAHRQLSRGQSYYAGDRLNKALVTPERVEAVLKEVKALPDTPPVPVAPPKPEPDPEPPVAPPHPVEPTPPAWKDVPTVAAVAVILAVLAKVFGWELSAEQMEAVADELVSLVPELAALAASAAIIVSRFRKGVRAVLTWRRE